MTALSNVRVEVAFDADPNTTTPAFRDLTSRARLDRGISINRGRSEQFDAVRPGRCTLTLNNDDGALTPGHGSAFANLKPQNRVRVTYRDPAVAGNLLSAEDASFEGGTTGSWGNNYFTSPGAVTLGNSSTRASHGSRSLLITFPTASGGAGAQRSVSGLVLGRTYTMSARVYVPTGVPNLNIGDPFGATPTATSSVKNAWQTISVTWTAASTSVFIVIRSNAATTSGQQAWVDEVRVDESAAPTGFTTDPMPIVYRFDGYVTEWPTEWPTGGQSHSTSTITAYDLMSRLARSRKLGSVIAETVLDLSPAWYFPLSEARESSSVGDIAGGAATLDVKTIGAGGELEFGAGTGPPTDGGSSPVFTPGSATDGLYLRGAVPGPGLLANSASLVAHFLTAAAAQEQVAARWRDVYGMSIEVGTNSTGRAVARFIDPWEAVTRTVTSSASVANNRTHSVAATLAISGGAYTLRLYVDGVQVGTPATWSTTAGLVYAFNLLEVGGTDFGSMFAGTVSHVAGFGTELSLGQVQDIRTSATTGFAGERSDGRIERVLTWGGVPSVLWDLDTGLSTVGHVDPTGKTIAGYLDEIAFTEGGAVFACTDGCLKFYSRDRAYDAAAPVVVSSPADDIDPSTQLENTLDRVANIVTATREGGARVQVEDAASISSYGSIEESIGLVSATDDEVLYRANWFLAERSTPRTVLPELQYDALTATAGAREIEIGARVQVTGMPSQSPSATFDLRAEGYDESIGRGGWSVKVNASQFLPLPPLILNDDPRGRLDSGNVLVY